MIYLTQLIFVKEGKENVFHEFEDFAIPLMEKYNGRIIHRLRPQKKRIFQVQRSNHTRYILSLLIRRKI
jgi:hypothetical protein